MKALVSPECSSRSAPIRRPRLLQHKAGRRAASTIGTAKWEEIDGAWWPWTTNLVGELDDIIAAVATRIGDTQQIMFDWNSLSSQHQMVRADGVLVSDPLPGQPPDVLRMIGVDGVRLSLLIVTPSTEPDRAYAAMRDAAAGIRRGR